MNKILVCPHLSPVMANYLTACSLIKCAPAKVERRAKKIREGLHLIANINLFKRALSSRRPLTELNMKSPTK